MPRFSGYAGQALFVHAISDLLGGEPSHFLRLGLLADNRLLFRNDEQESDVVVLMQGLVSPRRNIMHIHIENLAEIRSGIRHEIVETRFLLRLANRSGEHIRFPVRMTAKLQPAPELSMIRQECGAALARNDPGRRRDMPGKTVSMKTALVLGEEFSNPIDCHEFVGMTIAVAIQESKQVSAIHIAKLAADRRGSRTPVRSRPRS